jgi:hypothetical protein
MNSLTIDTSDPGKAALVGFAAAWLYSRTSGMNAENRRCMYLRMAVTYGDEAFAAAQFEALKMANTGETPKAGHAVYLAECSICDCYKPVCCDDYNTENADGIITHVGAVCRACCPTSHEE